MSLLQYTSKEMFSSTELIRKSKMVFDKINNKEIEKAIILRDGKPSFMLMDFYKYEALINEYLELKEQLSSKQKSTEIKTQETIEEAEAKIVSHETNNNTSIEKDSTTTEQENEINENELEKALAAIDNLDFNTTDEIKSTEDKKKEDLKDFWE